jgi:phage terminase Nu1 subunit (DNA packaging protein)
VDASHADPAGGRGGAGEDGLLEGDVDAVLAPVVACVLSDFVFETTSKQGGHRGALIRLLKLYAAVPAHRRGTGPAALFPHIAELHLNENSAESIRRGLGLSFSQERARWDAIRAQDGAFAAVPPTHLAHYVDPHLWPVAATIIREGPGVYSEQVQRVLRAYADRNVRATVRRPGGGPMSQGALNTLRTAARRLVASLPSYALLADHPAAAHLSAWAGTPLAVANVRSRAARADRVTDPSAPSLRELRLAIDRLGREIRHKLKVSEPQDEQPAIEKLTHVDDRGLFRLLRNRALLLTLCFGPRVRSVSRLQIGDLVEDYSHPELPGVHAALRLYPDKKGQPIERFEGVLKPIPDSAVLIYRSLIAFYRTVLGELPDDTPLFLTYLAIFTQGQKRSVGLSTDGIRSLLGGTRRQVRPMKALLPQGVDPCVGYTPHNVRAASSQLLQHSGAKDWCDAHLIDPARRPAMTEALLDHFMDSNMLALYSGDSSAPGRERLCGWAISIICELLLTGLGARRQPDVRGYQRAVKRLGQSDRELRALELQIAELRTRAASLAHAGRQIDAIVLATVDAAPLEDERWRLTRERVELHERTAALEERKNWLPVPDTNEETGSVDFAGLRQVPSETPAPTKKQRRVPARDWLTRHELATIIGRSPTTITRWVREGIPDLHARQNRPPWTPGRPPLVAFNTKRQVFWIPGLNRAVLFDTHRKRDALLNTLLADPPIGWRSSPTKIPAAAQPPRYLRPGSAQVHGP